MEKRKQRLVMSCLGMLLILAQAAWAGPDDVNGDGIVNFLDMQRVINCLVGTGSCAGADVNLDGSDNFLDLQLVINGILNPMTSSGTPEYFSFPEQGTLLDFGETTVGVPVSQNLSLANTGDGDLSVNLVTFGGVHASDFSISSPEFPLILAAGSVPQAVTLQCTPSDTGIRTANLQLSTNDPALSPILSYPLRCSGNPEDPLCNLNMPFDIENNSSVGSPGKGYDSDRDRIKPMSCLNGTMTEVGGGVGELNIDQITNYETLYEKLTNTDTDNFGLNVTVPFFFGLDLGLDFGRKETTTFTSELTKSSLSQSFVYQYEVRVPNLEFSLDTTGEQLNSIGEQVLGDACQFRMTCGDQFVYQTERGASLYIALTFDFASETHKETFNENANGNFGISLNPSATSDTGSSQTTTSQTEKKDLASISANWEDIYSNISESIKKHSSLTISVLQLGGNVSALPTILGGDFSCTLDEISPCQELIDQLASYASTKEFAEGVETKPAILNYRYRPYEEVGVFPGLSSELTDDIRQARRDLAQEYEGQTGDRQQAAFKLEDYQAMLTSDEKQELITLISLLDSNISRLRQAAGICFSDLPSCVNAAEKALDGLQAYDADLLILPDPIEILNNEEIRLGPSPELSTQVYCEVPPDYIISGIGIAAGSSSWNAWSTVKLEGRRINANGTLGPRETFCHGPVQHWIATPDDGDYVLTGVGVASTFWKKSSWGNTKYYSAASALHGWYREFDPVNRALKGEVHFLRSGVEGLAAKFQPEEHGFDIDRTIITGVGAGLNPAKTYGNFGLMTVKTGTLH